ncbi:hypothetical protein K440DRAFT_685692 [Wilcoxina mikolae CBS 423.85]|nr:hypothetical protein K440DRAFT_685692 [Wilcoxina mikolae CBS 423.85]
MDSNNFYQPWANDIPTFLDAADAAHLNWSSPDELGYVSCGILYISQEVGSKHLLTCSGGAVIDTRSSDIRFTESPHHANSGDLQLTDQCEVSPIDFLYSGSQPSDYPNTTGPLYMPRHSASDKFDDGTDTSYFPDYGQDNVRCQQHQPPTAFPQSQPTPDDTDSLASEVTSDTAECGMHPLTSPGYSEYPQPFMVEEELEPPAYLFKGFYNFGCDEEQIYIDALENRVIRFMKDLEVEEPDIPIFCLAGSEDYWQLMDLLCYVDHSLDLIWIRSDDEKLILFFRKLKSRLYRSCKCEVCHERLEVILRNYFYALRYATDSPHHQVRNRDFLPWCFERLVGRYIASTVWRTYWTFRDKVKLSPDWDKFKEVVLDTTIEILERNPTQRWEKMKDVRDRFLFRYEYVKDRLREGSVPARIKAIFVTVEKAWKYAIKAVARDLRNNRIPDNIAESATVLLLTWSIDSRNNSDPNSIEASPKFCEALRQWVAIVGSGIERFVDLCWPDYCKDHENNLSDPAASELPPPLLDSVTYAPDSAGDSQFTPDVLMNDDDIELFSNEISVEAGHLGLDDLQFTRDVLMHCMDDDDIELFSNEISLEAAAIAADLGRSESAIIIDPLEVQVQQFAIEPGIDAAGASLDLMASMILVMKIIASFLSPSNPSYRFLQGSPIKKITDDVRGGTFQSLDDVRVSLLREVSPDAIAAVLQFVADCASRLYKMGFTTTEDSGDAMQGGVHTSMDTNEDDQNNPPETPWSTGLLPPFHPLSPPLTEHSARSDPGIRTGTPGVSSSPPELIRSRLSPTNEPSTTSPVRQILPKSPVTTSSSAQASPANRRKYNCRYCTKSFPAKTNCTRHEKSVHGPTIICDRCEKPIKVGRADYRTKHAEACKALQLVPGGI